jgi:hypothetical protein
VRAYLVFVPGVLAIVAAIAVRGWLGVAFACIGVAWCVATAFFIRQSAVR